MRKIDLTMGDPNKHRVFCTDFGATLDLMGAEKDNSSVNNHAIIDIFFVAHSWRRVQYRKKNDAGVLVLDETIVNECDKWIIFGDTYSKGKKNDHVFHNACLTYLIKYYDEIRATDNQPPIPINVVWTDNCPGQYRCRQNFLNVATAGKHHDNKTVVVHKLAQKFRFKGSWDATGKLVKERIVNNELKYDRCSNAMDCYLKLTRDLTQDGSQNRMQKLVKYEEDGDTRALKTHRSLRHRLTLVLGQKIKISMILYYPILIINILFILHETKYLIWKLSRAQC